MASQTESANCTWVDCERKGSYVLTGYCSTHQRRNERGMDMAAPIRAYVADLSATQRRRMYLLKNYNLTEEGYAKLLASQGNSCAICEKPAGYEGKMLAVDHDHSCCDNGRRSCGRCVRGLLCAVCNSMVSVYERAQSNHRLLEYLR